MRRVRFSAAASLDGYIAGPGGEFDWIPMDPDVDFGELMGRFDTVLLGRKTWEVTREHGGMRMPDTRAYVFSRTLRQEDCPDGIVTADVEGTVRALREEEEGKDIWLFGGGELFRSLLALGLVDAVEIAVVPVLLGGGIPLLPPPADRTVLRLASHRVYPKTGTVRLEYEPARS